MIFLLLNDRNWSNRFLNNPWRRSGNLASSFSNNVTPNKLNEPKAIPTGKWL
jgi:hypothetical protein